MNYANWDIRSHAHAAVVVVNRLNDAPFFECAAIRLFRYRISPFHARCCAMLSASSMDGERRRASVRLSRLSCESIIGQLKSLMRERLQADAHRSSRQWRESYRGGGRER